MKKILLTLLIFITSLFSKIMVSEGISYIGNGITLEEAEQIAINKAKREAINSLGVFLESKSVVINNVLTGDEIKTITGAIIKTKVLNKEKILENDIFLIKVKAEFNVNENSLDNAIKNYHEKSKSKKTIKKLTEIIQNLQDQLLKSNSNNFDIVEIVDEIAFTNKRLSKLLTTKEKINNEFEIRKIYEEKLKQAFINKTYPELLKFIKPKIKFSEIPEKSLLGLKLNYIGKLFKSNHINKILIDLEDISLKYEKLGLKVEPFMEYDINIKLPINIYINDSIISDYYIEIDSSTRKNFNKRRDFITRIEIRTKKIRGNYNLINVYSDDSMTDYLKSQIHINISDYVKLNEIEDIAIRLGKPTKVQLRENRKVLFKRLEKI